MKPQAVFFDLFGTLISHFSKAKHEHFMSEICSVLSVPLIDFSILWVKTFQDRVTGKFKSIDDNIESICDELGYEIAEENISQATELHLNFTKEALQPKDGAIETLDYLKSLRIKIGLISDCAPDVLKVWQESAFSKYIIDPVFSFDVGIKKPNSKIYKIACRKLHVNPNNCFYVGDGSSNELSGAESIGIKAILICTPLSDVYDPIRKDVENWTGMMIHKLTDLKDLIEK